MFLVTPITCGWNRMDRMDRVITQCSISSQILKKSIW